MKVLVKNPNPSDHFIDKSPIGAPTSAGGFRFSFSMLDVEHSEDITYDPALFPELSGVPEMKLPSESAQEMKKNSAKLMLREEKSTGRGVFVKPNETIEKDQCLCLYGGELVREGSARSLYRDYNMQIQVFGPNIVEGSKESLYLISSENKGNIARFFQDLPQQKITFKPSPYANIIDYIGIEPFHRVKYPKNKAKELTEKLKYPYKKEAYNIKKEYLEWIAFANVEVRTITLKKDGYTFNVSALYSIKDISGGEQLGFTYSKFEKYWAWQFFLRRFFYKKGTILEAKYHRTRTVGIGTSSKEENGTTYFMDMFDVWDMCNHGVVKKNEKFSKHLHIINILTGALTAVLLNTAGEDQKTLNINNKALQDIIMRFYRQTEDEIIKVLLKNTQEHINRKDDVDGFSTAQLFFMQVQAYQILAKRFLKDNEKLKCYLFEAAEVFLRLGQRERYKKYREYFKNTSAFIVAVNSTSDVESLD